MGRESGPVVCGCRLNVPAVSSRFLRLYSGIWKLDSKNKTSCFLQPCDDLVNASANLRRCSRQVLLARQDLSSDQADGQMQRSGKVEARQTGLQRQSVD